MSFDSPKLDNYTFKHPPCPIKVWWDSQLVKNQLADGSSAFYNKGFILKGQLDWSSDGWIDGDDYSNIALIYNSMTATALFYPRPDTYPTRCFKVQISNDFNFTPHDGQLNKGRQLYRGTITFESSLGEITSVATPIF